MLLLLSVTLLFYIHDFFVSGKQTSRKVRTNLRFLDQNSVLGVKVTHLTLTPWKGGRGHTNLRGRGDIQGHMQMTGISAQTTQRKERT